MSKQELSDIFETNIYKHLFDQPFEDWEIKVILNRLLAIEEEFNICEMTTVVPCTRFEYEGDSSTIGARWTTWVELFDLYVIANNLTGKDEQVRATFLSLMGADCYQIYKVNCKDNDNLEAIKLAMNKVLVTKRSEYTEILVFRRAVKRKDETVNDYEMRLRLLARYCNYGDKLEKEIERQFVVSCGMVEVEKECIRTDSLDLAKVLAMARGYERTANNLMGLRQPEYSSQINYNNSSGKEAYAKPKDWGQRRTQSTGNSYGQGSYASSSSGSSGRCSKCGRSAHRQGEKCNAADQKCRECGKTGHYAIQCRNKDSSRYKGSFKSSSGDGGRTSHDDGNTTGQDDRVRKRRVNMIKDGNMEISTDDWENYVKFQDCVEYGLNMIRSVGGSVYGHNGPRVKLVTQGREVSYLIDTGSAANVLDQDTFDRLEPKPVLRPCDKKFYGYSAEVPIKMLGQFDSMVKRGAISVMATFVVSAGKNDCLLCSKTACELGVITINSVIEDPFVELTDEQIYDKFQKLFSGKLGCLKGVCVKLDVDESVRPTRQPQRPVAFHLRDVVAKELEEQIEAGILERVDQSSGPTPWVSNMVIVPKDKPIDENGKPRPHMSVRITCDSKAVNKAIRRTRYPSKCIDDLVVQVNGSVVFSVIDIMKAFHQLELHEESRYLTTLTTHVGLVRYLRLHMGISCASEIFTEEIRKLLLDIKNQLNMTDDVLIYGRTRREHHESLMKVLQRLEDRGLTLNRKKCKFYKKKVVFFGMLFSEDGIGPTEDRCRALKEASIPVNAKDLRSFLCSMLWSARFVKDLCRLSDPLWKLLRAGTVWRWTEVEQQAFENVKTSITTKCMAYFNKDWNTELEVDASPVGLGAILKQYNPVNPEMERALITFKSRLLTENERKLSQVEKEALGCVWGPESNWIYLVGKPFVLITDNRAVQLIFSNSALKPPARIERLALRLSQFDFTVVHRPGKSNIADYYSRHPCTSKPSAFLQEVQKANETEDYINMVVQSCTPRAISMAKMEDESRADMEFKDLVKFIGSGKMSRHLPRSLFDYKRVFDELSVSGLGIVLRGCRIVVPSSLRARVMELAHVGHQGVVKTKSLIRARVWYPGIDAQVEEMMARCLACQANVDRPNLEPMRPSVMPAGPWQEVSADFYGPFVDTGCYWFVNHCDYSRYIFVDSIKSVAMDNVQPVLEEIFSMFGTPKIYKTDNGAPFMSDRFGEFADQWGFKHRKVTPLWPRANGSAESVMPKLGKVLKTCEVMNIDRKVGLNRFLRSYRATPHSSTKVAPAILFLGFCRLSGIPMLDQSRESVEDLHKKAVEYDRLAKVRMTENFNKANKVKECSLELGDMVLFRWHRTKKYMPLWDPVPYEVVEIKGSMIKGSRSDHTVTRNSSFFKLWDAVGSNKEPELSEGQVVAKKVQFEEQLVSGGENLGLEDVVEDVNKENEMDSQGQVLLEDPGLSINKNLFGSRREELEIKKYKVGRPTVAEQAERKVQAAEEWKAKELLNPPRRSARNKAKDI